MPLGGAPQDKAMSGNEEVEPERGDLSRQATAWLVKLEDHPEDDALRLSFVDWLCSSPDHLAAWEETTRVSLLITAAGPSRKKRAWIQPSLARATLRSRKALASTAIALALGWAIAPGLWLQLRADETTGTGQVRLVTLEDGSKVHLAPDSAIAFVNGAKGRNLSLLRGEAWFEVARDTARPFRIEAGASSVTVLGTAFSVRKTQRGADVDVARGKVAVTLPEGLTPDRVFLTAGQSLTTDAAGRAVRGAIRPDRVAVWREGIAIVDDQSIADVIDRIRPWYKGYIVVRGAALAERRVSGIYDLSHPDQALEALTRAHDVRVINASPWVRIVTTD
ncbi:FecR domain-containing protein [Novosphingobium sp. HR1a]|nr:FecR domain-containing protein [Novosphingobium sp. HR1a]